MYEYWPDGSLKTETYLTGAGEVRRVMRHADNAFRQETYAKAGDNALTAYRQITQYNGAGDVTAVGLPYNDPADFCGSPGSVDPTCTALNRDRLGRIDSVDQTPVSTMYTTKFSYDPLGNTSAVQMGCPGGTCGSGQPAANYQYDDFGNLVGSTLPWTDNGSGAAGTTHFEYDAVGNLLKKQTPGMIDPIGSTTEWLVFSYDSLSRALSEVRTYNSGSNSENLVLWRYDDSQIPGTNCPSTGTSLAKGRLQMMEDSLGKTWYAYDELGRVVKEMKERTGTTSCSSTSSTNNPNTLYSYTANGKLASVTYPYGRTVTYGYGSGDLADRVSSVNITSFDGSGWVDGGTVIQGAVWEPYGGLRGYEIDADGGKVGVEYLLGDDGTATPGTTCSGIGVPDTGAGSSSSTSTRTTLPATWPPSGTRSTPRASQERTSSSRKGQA